MKLYFSSFVMANMMCSVTGQTNCDNLCPNGRTVIPRDEVVIDGITYNQLFNHANNYFVSGTSYEERLENAEFGDIKCWDVSEVESFSNAFKHDNLRPYMVFAPEEMDLSCWDTSKAEAMDGMFWKSNFVGDVSNWDTSKVTSMANMFRATDFNGDISNWNTGKVTNMERMVYETNNFDYDLSAWDVSKVNDFTGMFEKAFSFSQSFDGWTVLPDARTERMFLNSNCAVTQGTESLPKPYDTSLWCDGTTPLGRYEIAHDKVDDHVGKVIEATVATLAAEVYIKTGGRIEGDMLSLELYGMIGASPVELAPLKCEDGVRITDGGGGAVVLADKKAYIELDLGMVTDKVSDGNTINFCASIVNTQNNVQVARLETMFNVAYTYESDQFDFSVSVDDPAAGTFNDARDFKIPVETFLCEADYTEISNQEKKFRIGQDIRVCATPNPGSTPFEYSVTGFKDVKCVAGENFDLNPSFTIDFAANTLNEIGIANGDGTNSFVFLLQENFLSAVGYEEKSTDRTLACTGIAVITTTNTRNGRSRVLDVSFGDNSLRSLQTVGDVQESEFDMSIGIEDSSAASAQHLLPLAATAIVSLVGAAIFVM